MRSGPLCFVIATTFKRFIWSDLVWVSGDTQQDCTMGIPNHCHAGAAALVAAGLLLTACGQSNSSAGSDAPTPPAEPVACPEPGDLTTAAEVLADRLPDEALLEIWQRRMVERGPRFTGSPALAAWHDFLAEELASYGLSVERDPMSLEWWHHHDYSLTLIVDGVETPIPVASFYPYSGYTPDGGVVGRLADAGAGLPQDFLLGDFSNTVVIYEEDQLPLTLALLYSTTSYVHDPDNTMTPATPYRRASVSFLTPQEQVSVGLARDAGAVAAIVSYDASAENAAGQYTPFLTNPADSQGLPTLYVDRATGDRLKAAIADGAQVRLELLVERDPDAETDIVIATLPGMRPDEVMLFNTHTDGTSASQENGTLGILALARYFASLPQQCRQRTMTFVMMPGHFHNGFGGDTAGFISRYPELIGRSVASLTMEHLGQPEWLDDEQGFHPSGEYEPGVWYGTDNVVQALMTAAVQAEDLRRVFVNRPIGVIYFGVGSPLNAAGVPNASYITGPNMMLSFAEDQHVEKVDYARMAAEIRSAARIATAMDATSTELLCAGVRSQSPTTPSGCFP